MNLKEIADKFKSKLMLNSLQCKVRDVTSYEEFGPSTQDMRSIIDAMAQSTANFNDVCRILWKRLFDDIENDWVRVYKSLKLLHYIILHGQTRFIDEARKVEHSLRLNLLHYTCLDKDGRDQGINVRSRVCEILDLLSNDENLRTERVKSQEIQSKIGQTVVLSQGGISGQSSDGVISSIVGSLRSKVWGPNRSFSGDSYHDDPYYSGYSDEPKAKPFKEPEKIEAVPTQNIIQELPPDNLICFDDFLFVPPDKTQSNDLIFVPPDKTQSNSNDLIFDADFGDFVSSKPSVDPDWGEFTDGFGNCPKKESSEKPPVDFFDPFASIVESLKKK